MPAKTPNANSHRTRDTGKSIFQLPLNVEAPCGTVAGKLDAPGKVQQFLGIPYAQPPTGDLRWRAPQPLDPWHGIYPATKFGMPAPQNPSPLFEIRGPDGQMPDNEDCLYLNIYAPATADQSVREQSALPVMVWIHGGSFYMGSGCQPLYDGKYLAASGRAIVVTLNYRLGAFGFLRLDDYSDTQSSGNEGLQDQIAALRWVKLNIAAFGGDPQNITLFGESAGAMAITSLFGAQDGSGSPLAGTLFHKAIVQSGNPGVFHTKSKAGQLAEKFCEQLEILRSGKPLHQSPSTREILQAQKAVIDDPTTVGHWGHLPFKPVLDEVLIKHSPVEALRCGAGDQVAMMVGSNCDEWNLFSAARPESYTLDDQQIRSHLKMILPTHLIDSLLEHYRLRAERIPDNPWPVWSRTWNLMLTDMVFTVPGLRLLHAHKGKRYHYHFSQPLRAQPLLGACHASELGYVFGTHGDTSLQYLYGAETEPHILSESMRNAWLSFAECGNPGDDWPEFEHGHSRRFGNQENRCIDPAAVHILWEALDDTQLRGFL